jgi:hypothetical protein
MVFQILQSQRFEMFGENAADEVKRGACLDSNKDSEQSNQVPLQSFILSVLYNLLFRLWQGGYNFILHVPHAISSTENIPTCSMLMEISQLP